MKKVLLSLATTASLAIGGTFLSATPLAPVTASAQAATYSSCYIAMNGERWCYRTGCTAFEYWAQGCRTGWVKRNTWYA